MYPESKNGHCRSFAQHWSDKEPPSAVWAEGGGVNAAVFVFLSAAVWSVSSRGSGDGRLGRREDLVKQTQLSIEAVRRFRDLLGEIYGGTPSRRVASIYVLWCVVIPFLEQRHERLDIRLPPKGQLFLLQCSQNNLQTGNNRNQIPDPVAQILRGPGQGHRLRR